MLHFQHGNDVILEVALPGLASVLVILQTVPLQIFIQLISLSLHSRKC